MELKESAWYARIPLKVFSLIELKIKDVCTLIWAWFVILFLPFSMVVFPYYVFFTEFFAKDRETEGFWEVAMCIPVVIGGLAWLVVVCGIAVFIILNFRKARKRFCKPITWVK